MPLGKRADIALTRNAMKLPVEIKGQWHPDVWNAASDQLDAKYAVDWQAEDRGTYIALWFGDVPGKQLPRHPEGLEPPASPGDLLRMLIERLPETRRGWIRCLRHGCQQALGSFLRPLLAHSKPGINRR